MCIVAGSTPKRGVLLWFLGLWVQVFEIVRAKEGSSHNGVWQNGGDVEKKMKRKLWENEEEEDGENGEFEKKNRGMREREAHGHLRD